MFFAILIILFILVFVFLFYRIQASGKKKRPDQPVGTYVCPQCNESDCECHKVEESK